MNMNAYKIESNVPMPRNKPTKYPFGEMQVGDSFFVPVAKNGDGWARSKQHNRLTAAINSWRRTNKSMNHRFKIRSTEEPHGVRCWRVEDGQ